MAGSADRTVVRADAAHRVAAEQSLDLVQRVVVSSLIVVVFGSVAAVLAAYLVLSPETFDRSTTIGLWCQTGVIGLICSIAVCVLNRRKAYSPWVLLGLVPMAVVAYWIL